MSDKDSSGNCPHDGLVTYDVGGVLPGGLGCMDCGADLTGATEADLRAARIAAMPDLREVHHDR